MKNLENKIKENFGFKNVSIKDKLSGFSSDNFLIIADGIQYFLKLYTIQSEEKINFLEKIALSLYEATIPSIVAIEKSGHRHFTHDGIFYSVFPFIHGKVLHGKDFSSDYFLEVVKTLNKLNDLKIKDINLQTSIQMARDYNSIKNEGSDLIKTIEKSSLGKNADQLTIELISLKINLLKKININDFYHFWEKNDLVHGDLNHENMMFSENGKLLAFLDFEYTHLGHRMEDAMKFILFVCFDSGFKEENFQLARYFLHCYRKNYPFSYEELKFGIDFIIFDLSDSFFIEKKLYETKDIFFLQLVKRDIAKLNYFNKYKDVLLKKLYKY